MNVNIVSEDICCGCGACYNICPKNAILMKEARGGFLKPYIDEASHCVNCGLCLDICPVINPVYKNKYDPPSYIIKSSTEIRLRSSSGGVFNVLAQKMISDGGYVVGALFVNNHVILKVTNNLVEAKKFSGSKYIASESLLIYREVKKLLVQGKRVLFSGMPCQIAALYNYLGEKFDNLLTVEIVCHGAPSQKMFQSFISESNFDLPIKDVIFRDKNKYGWDNTKGFSIILENNEKVVCDNNIYLKVFLENLGLRQSCTYCIFAETPRQADITLGDYWNAKHKSCEYLDDLGISIATINTDAGLQFFDKFINSFEMCIQTTYVDALTWNRNKKVLNCPGYRERFLRLFDETSSISKAYDYTVNWKYDVGIAGIVNNANYGGLLTYYALYKVIESMGYSVILINNPIGLGGIGDTHARLFFNSHTTMSVQRSCEEQSAINSHLDTVVLGSDQVWNYSLFNSWRTLLYLDFIEDSKKKIAYASSFGHDHHTYPSNKIAQISSCLNKFDYISVREKSGVNILRDSFNINAVNVLDPVFLMSNDVYRQLINQSQVSVDPPYVGSYFLNPYGNFKLSIIRDISNKLGLRILNMTDGEPSGFERKSPFYKKMGMDVLCNVTIEDWLKVITSCSFFVTDSYHACCICILFNKRFILINNDWALSRLETLMDTFHIQNRWLKIDDINEYSFNQSWFEPLDYDEIHNILSTEILKSVNWLKNALHGAKRYIPLEVPISNIDKCTSLLGNFVKIVKLSEQIDVLIRINTEEYSIKHSEPLSETIPFGDEKSVYISIYGDKIHYIFRDFNTSYGFLFSSPSS